MTHPNPTPPPIFEVPEELESHELDTRDAPDDGDFFEPDFSN